MRAVLAVILVACGACAVQPSPPSEVGKVAAGQDAAQYVDAAARPADATASADASRSPEVVSAKPCASDPDCADRPCIAGACAQCAVLAHCATLTDSCIDYHCVAATPCKTDKHCTAAGLVCDTAASLCVQCITDGDCPTELGLTCQHRRCLPKPSPCASSKQCAAWQVCDKVEGACFECSSAGDCTSGLACIAHQCLLPVCKAATVHCTADGQLATCDGNGATLTVLPCPDNGICADGTCKAKVCKPGAAVCVGASTAVCNDSGTGASVAIPCAAKQFCVAGSCSDQMCAPASTQCAAGKLQTCAVDGSTWATSDCPTGTVCTGGGCAKQVCQPLALGCSGDKLVQCDTLGLGEVVKKDCALGSQVCVNGACGSAVLCQPGQKACAGAKLLTCAADGKQWSEIQCTDTNACTQDTCLAASPKCEFIALSGNACDDGEVCTVADKCLNGACAAGPALACDDKNPCTIDTCTPGKGCVYATAPKSQVDVVIWVDTSASMAIKVNYFNQTINGFAGALQAKGVDYRIVLYGTTGLCVPASLGDGACGVGAPDKLLLVKSGVASTNGLMVMQTASNFEKFASFLRPQAVHHMLGITDDNTSMADTTFKPNYANLLSSKGLNAAFVYHSICSFPNKDNPSLSGYCQGASGYSKYHVALAKATGGSLFQVCDKDWTAHFAALAEAVAAKSGVCGP